MPSQEIKPIDDGVQLTITDDSGYTYRVCFHVPANGQLDLYGDPTGDFRAKVTDKDNNSTEFKPLDSPSTQFGK